MNGDFWKVETESGITLVLERIPQVRSVSVGLFVRVGSRDEPPHLRGITHFLEHMVFKGTRKRDARAIAMEFEDRGGYLDGATSKEYMALYGRVLDEDLGVALDVIGDMVSAPLFREEDIERERRVILEEYRAFLDTPDDYVFHLLFQGLYGDHPLAEEIMGSEETIRRFDRESTLRWWQELFRPGRVFLSAAGSFDPEALVEGVRQHFRFPSPAQGGGVPPRRPPESRAAVFKRVEPRLQQVHYTVGCLVPGYPQKTRYPLMVLNSILGGGMSSRVFYELREVRGLVYSISSFLELYSDSGVFGLYFSVAPEKLEEAHHRLMEQLERIREEGVTEKELLRAKHRARGSLALSQESTSSRMNRLASMELYLGEYLSVDDTLARFEAVSLEEVNRLARTFLVPERLAFGLVGPQVVESFNPKE